MAGSDLPEQSHFQDERVHPFMVEGSPRLDPVRGATRGSTLCSAQQGGLYHR